MSFFDKKLLSREEPFIGLDNYVQALTGSSSTLWQSVFNTLFFAIASLALGIALAMFIAVKLIKPLPGRGFFRALFLVPWVTPPLVASFIWRNIMSANFSPINSALIKLGLIQTPVSFLDSTEVYFGFLSIPLLMITIVNVWSIFPFLMVMFIAGLQTVPHELYEAAKMDGASVFQRIRNIDLPALLPMAILNLIMAAGGLMNVGFEKVWLLQTDLNKATSDVIAVYVYEQGIQNAKYSYSTAVGLFNTVVNIALLHIVNKIASKVSDVEFV